jgi:hypothetical protein
MLTFSFVNIPPRIQLGHPIHDILKLRQPLFFSSSSGRRSFANPQTDSNSESMSIKKL